MTNQERRSEPVQSEDSWELLTQDALSRDEQAFLRALADEDDADGMKLEAHTPLDASFRERATDRLLSQLAEAARLRRRRTTRIAATSAVFAAAAALLLMMRPPQVKVPEYALAIEGQIATERGAQPTQGTLELNPSTVLDIKLTPATRVTDRLTVSAFLEREGKVVAWPVQAQRASSGAFRIRSSVRDLLQTQFGEWNAIFVIGPDAVSEPPALGDDSEGLTVIRAQLRYHP